MSKTTHLVRIRGNNNSSRPSICYLADPLLYRTQQSLTAFDSEIGYAHPFPSKEEADTWIQQMKDNGSKLEMWSEPLPTCYSLFNKT